MTRAPTADAGGRMRTLRTKVAAGRTAAPRVALCVVVGLLASTPAAAAAVSVSRAELSGGKLRVEGSGAVANATVGVSSTESNAAGRADGSGAFRVESSGFQSSACRVSVTDGATSTTATLSGCTPTQLPSSAPRAPVLVSPAAGASAVQPVTLDWSDVTDVSGPIVGYDWEVATTTGFTTIVAWGTPGSPAEGVAPPSQDRLSGLPNGTYVWRVRSIRRGDPGQDFAKSAWSEARTIVITGSAPGTLPPPSFTTPADAARFHPFEFFDIEWTAVAGVRHYLFEYDTEPTFSSPLLGTHEPASPKTSVGWGEQIGPVYYRVRSVNADGVKGLPSATRSYTISYNAPVPPPPQLVSPTGGQAAQLPVRFDWTDQPNPQPGMYELWVDDDPAFTGGCGTIELCIVDITRSEHTVTGLTGGTKYWKVRSFHGDAGPGVGATAGFSATGSFTLPTAAPALTAFELDKTFIHSGDHFQYRVEVTPFPARGEPDTQVEITSDNPAVPSPGTIAIPSGQGDVFLRIFTTTAPKVQVDTVVTLTARFNGSTRTAQITVKPPSIKGVDIGAPVVDAVFAGGVSPVGHALFNGIPDDGAMIALRSTNPAAHVPAALTIQGLDPPSFQITTDRVTSTQTGFIEATWKGVTVRKAITLHPPPTLLAPADGASVATGSTVIFDWETLAGISYVIQVDDSPSFTAPLTVDTSSSRESSFQTSTLPAGTLHWRVRTVDVYGQLGDWSAVRTLNVGGAAPPPPPSSTPPAAPTLVSPGDGFRASRGSQVTFDWSDVTGAASYQLQVDAESGFAAPFALDQQGIGTSRFSTSTLPVGKFRWRARAIGAGGAAGAWSSSRRVEIR